MLDAHFCGSAQDSERVFHVLLHKWFFLIQCDVAQSMHGIELHFPVNSGIFQNLVKTWDKVVQILFKSLKHVARQIRHQSTRQSSAVPIIRLDGIFDICSHLLDIYLLLEPNNQTMECYQPSFSHFSSSSKELYEKRLNTLRQFRTDHVTSLSQAHLHHTTLLVLLLLGFIICLLCCLL